METAFQTPLDELIEAKNKIKELDEKIKWLECEIKEKTETISAIEDNMETLYVENWTVTDKNGKGEFSGNICWIKGGGIVFYKNNTIFEGSWDSTGEITEGELRGTYSDEILTKWEYGEEIDLEDEEEEEDE